MWKSSPFVPRPLPSSALSSLHPLVVASSYASPLHLPFSSSHSFRHCPVSHSFSETTLFSFALFLQSSTENFHLSPTFQTLRNAKRNKVRPSTSYVDIVGSSLSLALGSGRVQTRRATARHLLLLPLPLSFFALALPLSRLLPASSSGSSSPHFLLILRSLFHYLFPLPRRCSTSACVHHPFPLWAAVTSSESRR